MRIGSFLSVFFLVLGACTGGGSDSSSSSGGTDADGGAPGDSGTAATPPGATPPTTPPGPDTLNGATIEVLKNGTALKIEPKLSDNDYGYVREFVFGKSTVAETNAMGDDEVGVIWSDGNIDQNSFSVKLRLNFNQGRIYEVHTLEGKDNTATQPGVATKELSEDKKKVILYTYKGKLFDTGAAGRPQTPDEYTVTLKNLNVERKK